MIRADPPVLGGVVVVSHQIVVEGGVLLGGLYRCEGSAQRRAPGLGAVIRGQRLSCTSVKSVGWMLRLESGYF